MILCSLYLSIFQYRSTSTKSIKRLNILQQDHSLNNNHSNYFSKTLEQFLQACTAIDSNLPKTLPCVSNNVRSSALLQLSEAKLATKTRELKCLGSLLITGRTGGGDLVRLLDRRDRRGGDLERDFEESLPLLFNHGLSSSLLRGSRLLALLLLLLLLRRPDLDDIMQVVK